MFQIKSNILKLINKLLHRNSSYGVALPSSKSETTIRVIISSGIIKDFERDIDTGLNIKKLDAFYGKKLKNEKSIYNMPLVSK